MSDGGFTSPFTSPSGKKKKVKGSNDSSSGGFASPLTSPAGKSTRKKKAGDGGSGFASPLTSPSGKKLVRKSSSGDPDAIKRSGKIPENEREFAVRGEEERMQVYVYERNKPTKPGQEPKPIANVPGKIQGIWYDNVNAEVSPCTIWAYPSVPKDVAQMRDVYGVWGYKPGVDPANDPAATQPEDMWFFAPKTKPPSYFTPRGIWTYPLVKRDTSQLADYEAGFLNVGERAKMDKLDVGGTWKLLYKKGGNEEDETIGPGIKPRTGPMTVHVETPDGLKTLTFAVRPDDTIDSLQDRIQEKEGIPKPDQRLMFGGIDLDRPQHTLENYNIQDGDTLKLMPMFIYVKNWTGAQFTIFVRPDQTISETKDQILKAKKIPIKEQRLTFQGTPLTKATNTLKDYQVRHKSILEIPPMTIYVRTPDGKKTPLQVQPSDMTVQVKKQITNKLGIPPNDQNLTFRNKPMIDKKTLDESGVEDGDVLDLVESKMQIHVEHWDGSRLTLEVHPEDTIDSVQQQILKRKKVPLDQQRLVFQSAPLKDPHKTLEQYGVKNDDILELLPMQVTVKTPDGKSVPLIVKPTDTVKDIKRKVAEKENIPEDDQRLTFNGKPLDDPRKTLDDLGIKHGDTIPMEGMRIHVKDWDGKKATYDVSPNDTLEDVKRQVAKRQGIPVDQQRVAFDNRPLKDDRKTLKQYGVKNDDILELLPMQVTVKTPDGKSVPLIVKPTDTVKDIKRKVAEKENIPEDDQRLTFNGKPLDDPRKTLDDLGIKHGDTIPMEGMRIHVKDWDGKKATYDVSPNDTLEDVKRQVAKRQGIPVDQQRVAFDNRPLKDDRKTLKQYGVKNDDILELLPMQVTVKTPDGKSVPLIVKPTDTVKDIKRQVAEKENIPEDDQRLTFNGKPLDDPRKTLDDLGIKHGDTIPMEGMRIHVKDWDGKKATYDVSPNDTLEDVKRQVAKRQGIPVDQQRVAFDNRPLKDDRKTLKQYGVKNDDILELLPMQVTVKTPDGKSVPLIVKPTDTVKDIKRKVAEKENIPEDDQRLTFNGKPLDDPRKTLDDLGIKHGDTIPMEGMRIHVKDWDGKKATYDVSPNDTLEDVKRQVAKRQGIPVDQQRVAFDNRPLKDDRKTLKQYGVKNDDILELLPMQVTVKTPDGKSVPLIVKPTDTVKDIKRQVAEKENIPEDDQRLTFNGKPLDDPRKTLDDLGIKHGDTIPMEGMRIHVKDWDGKKATYDVSPNDTLEDVKRQVAKRQGIPVDQQRVAFDNRPLKDDRKTLKQYGVKNDDILELLPMQVTVKTPDGKSVPLIVKPTDTVKDIKRKVAEKENIPEDDQRLTLNGKPLDDPRKTLDDLGIKHGDTIPMEGMQIFIKHWKGDTTTLNVCPSDTLDGIRDQIMKIRNVPRDHQRLNHKNRPLQESDDRKSLAALGVKHQDTLVLDPMEIKVRAPNGNLVTIAVDPADAVRDLKDRIQEKLGIPPAEQKLSNKGKPLQPDNTTLNDNGVKHGDILALDPMQIYVRNPRTNKKYTLDVSPADTIDDVKSKLLEKSGIPKRQQRLKFGDTPLDNYDKTLRDLKINDQDVLDLEPMQIHAKLPNGRKVTLEVEPSDTTKDIKDKIEKIAKIPATDQTIKFNDKPLANNRTLDDSGIEHNDTVFVEQHVQQPKTPATPRKSYLPANWKEQRDRFGEIITTTYEIDHNVDEGENFIRGITAKEKEKFKFESPKRKSQSKN